MDWINNGKVYIYSNTEELLHTLTVGVNPQDAGFYYPGVGVDTPNNNNLTVSNYPNPFSTSTTISCNVNMNLHELSRIEIYNIMGQKVKTFISFPNRGLGTRGVVWDGKDETGNTVSGGIYLYKIITDGVETAFHKMVYLK